MENYAGESRNDSLDLLLVANKRKPNFTEGESLYLISQFERNATVLTSKLNDASTNKQKVEVWKRICNDYNSKNPIVLRTANDLKRKWKNMVRAAKKELLETTMTSSDGSESVSQRKLSPVSQRIVEILRISASMLLTSFEGSFAEDQQGEQALESFNEEDSETNHLQENNPQQAVIHVVVTRPEDIKPSAVVPPDVNTEEDHHTTEQNINRKSDIPLNTANASTTEDHATTQAANVPSNNFTVESKSNVPVNAVSMSSRVPTLGQIPSISSTNLSSGQVTAMRSFRPLAPQQKRMLPSSLAHVIKKRKLSDHGQDESLSNVRAEVEKLKKEKLILEKEKLALEKEKLVMEKEKLALEIRFLRDQMA